MHWLLTGEGIPTVSTEIGDIASAMEGLQGAGATTHELREVLNNAVRATEEMRRAFEDGPGIKIDERQYEVLLWRNLAAQVQQVLERLKGTHTFETNREDLPPVQP